MPRLINLLATAAIASAATLEEVCTSDYASTRLPPSEFIKGITVHDSSVVATPVYNASVSDEVFYPDATFNYCNITWTYTHDGRNDEVTLTYWLPAPEDFENRFLSTGGGGYLISSDAGSLPGGIIYGAVAGTTDAGFGSLTTQFDYVNLLADGTLNYEDLYMFSYNAIHEMTVLGKEFTELFYNTTDKVYSYYQGCSEGGRDGWSQVQRFPDQFDGAIVGAPAFHFSFQQVQHAYSDIVEQTMGYYPPPCEMEKIMNATIEACDPLDGLVDGVVARNDLCKLHFNLSSVVGEAYTCTATPADLTGFPEHPEWPAQNGTVTAQGVAVAKKIIDGLKDSRGRQAYLSYTMSSEYVDAFTQYNNDTEQFELWPSDFAAEFILPFLELVNATSSPTYLNGVGYDTLVGWMYKGWQTYQDSLHTTWPDLTGFEAAGGKILHFHGESDFSIPTGSSIHYRESVREIMYPELSYNASNAKLNEWYRLFLVPGAQHCNINVYEPNGPFPQTNMGVMIEWVEKGVTPHTLNATHLAGSSIGDNAQICAWPLRPLWVDSKMECVYDQASLDTWFYDFNAFKMPVY